LTRTVDCAFGLWRSAAATTPTRKHAAPPSCCLCTVEGGALKATTDGRWCHLFCSQWLPETHVDDDAAMEPVAGVEDLAPQRLELTCTVCRKKDGACTQCHFKKCAVAFHPMCAFLTGQHRMEIQSAPDGETCEYMCYCVKVGSIQYSMMLATSYNALSTLVY